MSKDLIQRDTTNGFLIINSSAYFFNSLFGLRNLKSLMSPVSFFPSLNLNDKTLKESIYCQIRQEKHQLVTFKKLEPDNVLKCRLKLMKSIITICHFNSPNMIIVSITIWDHVCVLLFFCKQMWILCSDRLHFVTKVIRGHTADPLLPTSSGGAPQWRTDCESQSWTFEPNKEVKLVKFTWVSSGCVGTSWLWDVRISELLKQTAFSDILGGYSTLLTCS